MDALRAYGEVYSKMPVRKLGSERLIIRMSYLPDPLKPRLRFVAPPCNGEEEVRNLHFSYDVNSHSWQHVEPFIEAPGWYAAGFEDPIVESGRGSVSNTLLEYHIVQEGLRQRFERFQAELGLPVDFPRNPKFECK